MRHSTLIHSSIFTPHPRLPTATHGYPWPIGALVAADLRKGVADDGVDPDDHSAKDSREEDRASVARDGLCRVSHRVVGD